MIRVTYNIWANGGKPCLRYDTQIAQNTHSVLLLQFQDNTIILTIINAEFYSKIKYSYLLLLLIF